MKKRKFISIFIIAVILFTNLGVIEASGEEAKKETIRSETIPIRGAYLESIDQSLRVNIDKGIYYRPVTLTIETLDMNPYKDRYISASNFFKISIDNPIERHVKDRKIELSFEYYGGDAAGVYMLEDGSWTYLSSTLEDGRIKTYVNPTTISKEGNIFTVLVDSQMKNLYDTRGHWASDEIKTYTRRGIINGYPDKTFKPDRPITRAEFLILLSRDQKWKLPQNTSSNKFFKDVDKFNRYNEREIAYSYANNYIVGYPDRYFRPYNHITYKEVDIIMKRALNDPDFKWASYAEKMIYDKRVRSSSYDSYNNNITRAEFSYMLYKLNEWKY